MTARYQEIQDREDEVRKLIIYTLGLPWDSISTDAGPLLGDYINILIRLPEELKEFKDTNYCFIPDSIFHFTNIKSALSILDSCKFRLYNLYNKNDDNEFTFASTILGNFCKPTEAHFSNLDYEIKTIKENVFILSTTIADKFEDFWNKEYSDNGKGVAFQLSFKTNPLDWKGFYLSKIKYGALDNFVKLRDQLLILKNTNQNVSYNLLLNQIIPFHKDKKWIKEQEIRLMTFFPDKYKLTVHYDSGDLNIKYINLPIYSKDFNESNFSENKIPQFKIEKIFLGPKIEDDDILLIRKIIKEKYLNDFEIINYAV